jgi:hypothetical protein
MSALREQEIVLEICRPRAHRPAGSGAVATIRKPGGLLSLPWVASAA